MGKIVVNVTESSPEDATTEYELLPEGNYNVTIIPNESEVRNYSEESKGKGRPYLNLCFRVADGSFSGRYVWGSIPLFEEWDGGAPAFQFKQFFRAVGYGEQVDKAGAFEVPSLDELGGTRLSIRVKHNVNPSNKKKSAQANGYFAANGDVQKTTEKISGGKFTFGK